MPATQRTSSSISAVLPAYNEQAIIERTVRHVAEVLRGLATDFEVIVTNDGSRDHTGVVLADLQRSEPDLHLFLVNLLFGYTARDVDCAFKLFRRGVWQSMTVHARGATFSAEFLIKARRLGFHVKELPVSHFPRTAGNPTGARPAVIVRAFVEL